MNKIINLGFNLKLFQDKYNYKNKKINQCIIQIYNKLNKYNRYKENTMKKRYTKKMK